MKAATHVPCRTVTILSAAASIAVLAACTSGSLEDQLADTDELSLQLRSIESLFAPGSTIEEVFERYLEFFADDAILLPPGAQPVRGRDAIRDFYLSGFEGLEPISLAYGEPEFLMDAELALRVYEGVGVAVVTASGDTLRGLNRYVDALRKTPNGWRIAVHTWGPIE